MKISDFCSDTFTKVLSYIVETFLNVSEEKSDIFYLFPCPRT